MADERVVERIRERLYWAGRLGHKVKSKAGRKWAGYYAEDVTALHNQLRKAKPALLRAARRLEVGDYSEYNPVRADIRQANADASTLRALAEIEEEK